MDFRGLSYAIPANDGMTTCRRQHLLAHQRTAGIMSPASIAKRFESFTTPASPGPRLLGSRRSPRLPAIDSARGAAMVLVCVSHFAVRYVGPSGAGDVGLWLAFVAHVATPMFFIISGAMVGYLAATRPDTFDRVRDTLARRALFFLTIGHVLILGAHARTMGEFTGSTRMLFVTDTIALALLVSPRLVRIPARLRLAGAAAVYVGSCALVYFWNPQSFSLLLIKETLAGLDGPGFWSYSVPVLPWLAVHAAGTVLGKRLASASSAKGRMRIEAQLALAGSGIAALGMTVRTGSTFLISHAMLPGARAVTVARQLASPWQRVPPSPVHLLLFCGLALLAIASVFLVERLGAFSRLLAWLSTLGKTSAFVFILQFYVFYVIVPLLFPKSVALSPFIFIIAMLGIGAAARVWLERRSRLIRPSWFVAPTPTVPLPKL